MPTRTSGMPNLASCAAIRKSQAAATSSPPPRHQPGIRAITGAGNARTASQRSRRPVMNFSAEAWSSSAISLMSAPPIMLFSLWPAMTSTRMCRSVASACSPSRTPLMTAEPRMLSEPALQIVRRTTPRGSRSTPQWGLSICMEVSQLRVHRLRIAPLPGQIAGLSRPAFDGRLPRRREQLRRASK